MAEPETLLALKPVRRERAVGEEIEWLVNKSAPQALLRDLHRPVTEFKADPLAFERQPVIRGDAGAEVSAEMRATLFASYRVPIMDLAHTTRDMMEAYEAVRALIRLPWVDAPKFNKLHRSWKGQVGGGR